MVWQSEFSAALELLEMMFLEPLIAMLTFLLIGAAVSDVKHRRIPNILVLSGIVFAVIYNGIHPPLLRDNGWLLAVQGLGVGFAVFLPFYVLRAMGAGDVKLMAMVGAFIGPWNALGAALSALLAGGILALGFIIASGTTRRAMQNIGLIIFGAFASPAGAVTGGAAPAPSVGSLPYAVSIAVGTLAFLILKQLGLWHW